MDILDESSRGCPRRSSRPFGLTRLPGRRARLHPYDERGGVRYGTNYFLWIKGVLARRR